MPLPSSGTLITPYNYSLGTFYYTFIYFKHKIGGLLLMSHKYNTYEKEQK